MFARTADTRQASNNKAAFTQIHTDATVVLQKRLSTYREKSGRTLHAFPNAKAQLYLVVSNIGCNMS